ncbi:RidA family protein [Camelimonas lactis]|uniref:Enamine deaminase RidA (YjgF/YER057c/UK114 family) n=1 Tax=Camelimonas lactis TaxID=659006 RepID=A0A4R2GR98_9HYPH|nr:Rid family hydrolase [Camelimonas lactis]TCO12511.1 enamine deaminase RidA (YjgF/YER057c/UK114 family) [Camelimonas lactis]
MSDIGFTAVLPEGWPRPRGYAQGVVTTGGRVLRVAGQTGVAPGAQHVAPDADFGAQFTQALANVVAVVQAAGGKAEHIVSLRAYLTQIGDFNAHGAAVGAAWGASLGRHFPAMTIVGVTALLDPAARVEIEAEAVLP